LREFKDKHPRPEGSEPPHAPDEWV
jgi:hypothetical protein